MADIKHHTSPLIAVEKIGKLVLLILLTGGTTNQLFCVVAAATSSVPGNARSPSWTVNW
jgi:hypothetical protein